MPAQTPAVLLTHFEVQLLPRINSQRLFLVGRHQGRLQARTQTDTGTHNNRTQAARRTFGDTTAHPTNQALDFLRWKSQGASHSLGGAAPEEEEAFSGCPSQEMKMPGWFLLFPLRKLARTLRSLVSGAGFAQPQPKYCPGQPVDQPAPQLWVPRLRHKHTPVAMLGAQQHRLLHHGGDGEPPCHSAAHCLSRRAAAHHGCFDFWQADGTEACPEHLLGTRLGATHRRHNIVHHLQCVGRQGEAMEAAGITGEVGVETGMLG